MFLKQFFEKVNFDKSPQTTICSNTAYVMYFSQFSEVMPLLIKLDKQDFMKNYLGLNARKPVFGGCEQQYVHTRSLISAFVICLLKSIISRLATSKISIFWLVSEAEQAGLNITLSETRRQVFFRRRPFKPAHEIFILIAFGNSLSK